MVYLSVVIPAYNEEKRLPETLKKVRDYLNQQKYTYEVVVVNDGSTDETAAITSEFINSKFEIRNSKQILNFNEHALRQNSKLNFRLIDNKENRGKGAVVKQGMLEAKGEWRLFMDSDSSTDIHEIEKLFNTSGVIPANAGIQDWIPGHQSRRGRASTEARNDKDNCYEVVVGSRYLDKGSIKIKQPLSRRIISRVGNILVRMLLGIKSADTQCGFKLFSAKAAQEIFPKQTIDRWVFDVEILAIAIKLGYRIKEVPVDWYDAEGSTVKSSAALKTLKELFEIRKRIKKIRK